jgi:hypothetical protein
MNAFARRLQMVQKEQSSPVSVSGEPVPIGDLPGWTQIFVEDFNIDAPTGSWATSSSSTVVYTGDHGGQWTTYPDGWPSTYTGTNPGYAPAQVLSVHDGMLDFYLHQVNGYPSGSSPCPVLANGSKWQTYGRYEARFKLTYDDAAHMDGYKVAWLLWPNDNSMGAYAESDFPEANLNSTTVKAFSHYGGSGSQESFSSAIDFTQWHTFTQEWGVGYRKYYLDGNLLGTATNQIWDQPERWQLQTEVSKVSDPTTTGHLLLDWVAVYKPAP